MAGLAVARLLHAQGIPATVFEAELQPGGKLLTTEVEGYLIENGPNTILVNRSAVQALLAATPTLPGRYQTAPTAEYRYLVKQQRLRRLPTKPQGLLWTQALSWRAKVGILTEPWRKTQPLPNETVADFFTRRFGPALTQEAVSAVVGGIYAGAPQQLRMAEAFPQLVEWERQYGSVLRGFARQPKSSPEARQPVSFRGGFSALADALAFGLDIRMGMRVTHLASGPMHGWQLTFSDGRKTNADRVICALPAPAAAALFGPNAGTKLMAAADGLLQIPYASVAVVSLGYDAKAAPTWPPGFGALAPTTEQADVLGVQFVSQVFPERAPAGKHLLQCYVGGRLRPELLELDDTALATRAHRTLRNWLGLMLEPELTHVYKWPAGIPQYEEHHAASMLALAEAEAAHTNLHFLGNYRGGVGLSDVITQAEMLAKRIGGHQAD
jgi:oxygen-dependent protoporphyrinogen oxidase